MKVSKSMNSFSKIGKAQNSAIGVLCRKDFVRMEWNFHGLHTIFPIIGAHLNKEKIVILNEQYLIINQDIRILFAIGYFSSRYVLITYRHCKKFLRLLWLTPK